MSNMDKQSLINEITLKLVEDYGIKVNDIKEKLTTILTQYHVEISDESFHGTDLSTKYLMKKFFDGKSAIGMKEETLKQYQIAVDKLEKYSNKQMSEVESADVLNWLKCYGKEVSSVTLRNKYQLLSSVYSWLYGRRYIPHNPFLTTDPPKAMVIYKNPLTDFDLERIKKAIESLPEKESVRDMAILHFFISTGCRVSELKNVKISDLDLDKKSCIVTGKGRKQRSVILTERACFRINLYLETRKNKSLSDPLFASIRGDENEMTKDGIERIIHKIAEISGVENLTCHVFRRFYATELRKRNVPLQMIASSLGHANLNQINRYSLYNDQEMKETISRAL